MRHAYSKSSAEQPNQNNAPDVGERTVASFLASALDAMKRESPQMAANIEQMDEFLRSVMQ